MHIIVKIIGRCFSNYKRFWMVYVREDSRAGMQSRYHTSSLYENPYLGNWNNRANIEYIVELQN